MRMFRSFAFVAALIAVLSLAGCGRGSTQDVTKRVQAANVKTKAELEKLLGKPDDFSKLGPMETWTYKTSDGTYVVQIMGDTVVFDLGSSEKKK